MALGGVLMGKHIAAEAAIATPIKMVAPPPIALRLLPIPLQTTAKIGTKRAAVAVFEIKFESV